MDCKSFRHPEVYHGFTLVSDLLFVLVSKDTWRGHDDKAQDCSNDNAQDTKTLLDVMHVMTVMVIIPIIVR